MRVSLQIEALIKIHSKSSLFLKEKETFFVKIL